MDENKDGEVTNDEVEALMLIVVYAQILVDKMHVDVLVINQTVVANTRLCRSLCRMLFWFFSKFLCCKSK